LKSICYGGGTITEVSFRGMLRTIWISLSPSILGDQVEKHGVGVNADSIESLETVARCDRLAPG
jgi:hypothetical protein